MAELHTDLCPPPRVNEQKGRATLVSPYSTWTERSKTTGQLSNGSSPPSATTTAAQRSARLCCRLGLPCIALALHSRLEGFQSQISGLCRPPSLRRQIQTGKPIVSKAETPSNKQSNWNPTGQLITHANPASSPCRTIAEVNKIR
jgi:hypothetical protein